QKTQPDIQQKQAAAPERSKTAIKLDKQHRWKFGFSGSAGVSDVFRTVTAQKVVTSPFYSSAIYYNSNNTTSMALGAAPPPPTHSPSTEQPGFSFTAGGFVQRSVTRRMYFTLALNYHYFSSSIQTGSKVSLNGLSASAAANPSYLYGSSFTHINRYHFLELPVSLGYKINQSKKHPVTVDAGLSFSQLLGSDALYYNESTGTYTKNDGILNKFQVLANSALMVGFVHQKMLIQLGPQLQYGLGALLTSPSGNKEHLFFGGIKIVLQSNK
ncbi:MAG TPA: outer membrane beta-barrel protein, partial [Puia sp.]|nr:outer membrane beta-barrel protein [Puia sp.]